MQDSPRAQYSTQLPTKSFFEFSKRHILAKYMLNNCWGRLTTIQSLNLIPGTMPHSTIGSGLRISSLIALIRVSYTCQYDTYKKGQDQ